MKARYITALSVGTLVLLLAFQMVGVWYSYQSLMRKSAATLSSCFKATFSQVVDAPLNHLPYPDYTITHLTYVPYISHMNDEDKYLYISKQTSAVLQDSASGMPIRVANWPLRLSVSTCLPAMPLACWCHPPPVCTNPVALRWRRW